MDEMTPVRNRSNSLPDLWDDAVAAGLDEPGKLLYRSNLLGSDLRITNFGGGNTSAKVEAKDPLTGAPATVLWVKGSGGDIGSMALDGFATLYLDKLEQLKGLYRGLDDEDAMVGYLPHCTFDLNPRAASIDTPLHAFVPARHVDHVHPDAVIAIAASKNAERLTQEIFGGEIGFLPWQRPGFDLGLKLGAIGGGEPRSRRRRARRPRPVHLGRRRQGLLQDDAAHHPDGGGLARRQQPARRPSAGRRSVACLRPSAPPIAARLMPEIRGRIGQGPRQGRPFHRRAGGAGVRRLQGSRRGWRRSAPPAPTTSCAPRSARSSCPSIRRSRRRRSHRRPRRHCRGLSRRLRRLLRALQAARTRRRCATPTR